MASQLKKAFTDKGIAILVNHGIPEEKLKAAWNYLDGFCDLPTDVKEVYMRKAGNNHGYVKPGLEKFEGKVDELRYAFNICTLSGARLPEEPLPGFQDLISELTRDFKNLASLLLQALSVALGECFEFELLHMAIDSNCRPPVFQRFPWTSSWRSTATCYPAMTTMRQRFVCSTIRRSLRTTTPVNWFKRT